MNGINQIFFTPILDSSYDIRQRRETLKRIISIIFLLTFPLVIINFLYGAIISAALSILIIPFCLFVNYLNNKGFYYMAGTIISSLLLIILVFDICEAGGLTSDLGGVAALMVFVTMCSLFFGKGGIYIFSLITALLFIGIAFLEFNGIIKGPNQTDIFDMGALVVLLFGLSTTIWIIINNSEKNLSRIRKDGNSLSISYELTLEGLAKALEYRDQETKNHRLRVVEMSIRLAKAVGLQGDDLRNIKRGALVHDIGKLAIPDNILQKPGKLTEAEW